MMYLGIDNENRLVFEGITIKDGRLLWPYPIVTPARMFSSNPNENSMEPSNDIDHWGMVFREDSFDPTTRIKRGRLYQRSNGTQPGSWLVCFQPRLNEGIQREAKQCYTFQAMQYEHFLRDDKNVQIIISLGVEHAESLWLVISVERITTGEDLITLKARHRFGILPELMQIESLDKQRISNEVEKLTEDALKATSDSLVDRAREVASVILAGYLPTIGVEDIDTLDLSGLIKKLTANSAPNDRRVLIQSAEIINRLHSRTKRSEQDRQVKKSSGRRKIRPICEQDGELALLCVGTILCDLGWAEWT